MWATYNDSNFPIVNVKMTGVPENNNDFQNFLDTWNAYNSNNLNPNKTPYIFVFDTTEVGMVNMKYAFKMTSFIKELKRQENQYLKGSVIIVKNKYIKFLLKIIFFMQKPVADVHLTDSDDTKFLSQLISEVNTGIEKQYNNVSIVRA
jgi:hypothetical protein|tara:strand:- start:95 stop:538 length:444 start_codon:yes stop_codon:yes gene_type:complete